jgi:uncharacterized protein (UPF0548 family)
MRTRLRPFEADRLRAQPLTYAEVGASVGPLPPGYHHVVHSRTIGRGRVDFERAARSLMHWGLQRGAGLAVTSSSDRIEPGTVAVVRLGPGPLAVRAPVRVVLVVDEPGRAGFAYGTLPGHPESGEELFVVDIAPDDSVTLSIRGFSRTRRWWAWPAGPVIRMVQRGITRRYVRALGA